MVWNEILKKKLDKGQNQKNAEEIRQFTSFAGYYRRFVKDLPKIAKPLTELTKRESSPYTACNQRQAFFTSGDTKRYKLWSCQNMCEALIYLLDNIYIRFGTKLYRQIVVSDGY